MTATISFLNLILLQWQDVADFNWSGIICSVFTVSTIYLIYRESRKENRFNSDSSRENSEKNGDHYSAVEDIDKNFSRSARNVITPNETTISDMSFSENDGKIKGIYIHSEETKKDLSLKIEKDSKPVFCVTHVETFNFPLYGESESRALNPIENELVERVSDIIRRHIDSSNLNVPLLCSEVGMSRSLFFSKFKKITGVTPNSFLLNEKLKFAAALLIEQPHLTVTEVADKSGFATAVYFSRCFRKQYGVAPLNYKRNGTFSSSAIRLVS